jgi:glucokinase
MLSESLLRPVQAWKQGSKPQFCLGCDVGGSGLRIRLSNYFNVEQFIDIPHVKAQSTKEALDALNQVNSTIQKVAPGAECMGSAIAVAGPISNNTVTFTNWPGKAELRTVSLEQLPRQLFPTGRSLFLNDLEAGAYGVIATEKQGKLESLFEQMWPDVALKGKLVSDGRTAVLAMGSGLGVALIVKTPLLKKPLVLPTELGHLQIPTVCRNHRNAMQESQMIQYISDHYYNGRQMPEFEDIASGRGLCLVYQYLYDKFHQVKIPLDQIDAGDIAQKARQGDKIAREALMNHYIMFMRAAKAVATTLSCDSVLMALDNQVKNIWFVRSANQELKDELYTFIRPDWLKNIRVYTQTKVLNFNILGTDYMAHQIAEK